MNIGEEIKQKSFKNEHQKLQINILFTASWLTQLSALALKPLKITWQQFNILRILKGAHPKPASVKLLAERMIDKMSNASRLVEKLKQKGLVERQECPLDRRKVDVVITPEGLALLENATMLMDTQIERLTHKLSEYEAVQVNFLLDKLRR